MAAFSLDSTVMIAAVCGWHEHHARAVDAIERRLAKRHRMITPAHAMIETYAVLTRLPAPHRLAPADAWALVKTNFVEGGSIAAAPAAVQIAVLAELAASASGGGRTYDALIAATAAHAGADELLTFNPSHFEALDLSIVGL